MEQIRLGLENNLDVSDYANSVFSYKKMEIMRLSLEKDLNIDLLKNPELTVNEMEAIVVLLESGFFQKIISKKIILK